MSVVFVPSLAQGEEAEFEGSVTLRPPNFYEKYSYIEKCNFAVGEDGQMQSSMKQLSSIVEMVKLSEPHYEKVSLKHKNSGKKYSTFESLSVSSECHPILIEVASKIMSGFGLGNG